MACVRVPDFNGDCNVHFGSSALRISGFARLRCAAMAEQQTSWVDQVQAVEQSLVDVTSLDGDLVVEALSNIPQDARGRLRTMLVLAEEVVVQAAHGYQIVIDTGLGTAGWYVQEDPDAAAPQSGPVAATGQSWADASDADGGPEPAVLSLQSAPAPQPVPAPTQVQPEPLPTADSGTAATQVADPVPAPAQVQTDTQVTTPQPVQPAPQPILGPLSKAATRGQQMAPQQMVAHITVKAQPKLQPQPQPQPQQQIVPVKSSPAQPNQTAAVHPGQPPPPAAPTAAQRGTRGVGPVLGTLRQPEPQPKQPIADRPFQPDQAALAAFPNDTTTQACSLHSTAQSETEVCSQTHGRTMQPLHPCASAVSPGSRAHCAITDIAQQGFA